jgi:CubicO group peptidase (beta-lactamase class C family)
MRHAVRLVACVVALNASPVIAADVAPPAVAPTSVTNPAPNPSAEVAREARARHTLRGMVCAIVTKDGIASIGADGMRRRGSPDPITVDDRMHLGSCTKAFTATLAAVLVADGTIKWDSTVGEVLGKNEPRINDAWKPVALEDLLRHRGGAPADPQPDEWQAAFGCKTSPSECRAAFVRGIIGRAPQQARGTHVYSNQSYAIAGRMLEVAAGKDYETLLTERVLKPLGITHAGFGQPSRIDPNSPVGHDPLGMPLDIDNPDAIAPAGKLHMPVGEWAKFIAFELGATPPKELEGAAKLLAKMQKPGDELPHEALGWMTANRQWGGAVLYHSGSNTKWYCSAWVAPEKGFAVLAAVNQGGDRAQRACDEACSELIRRYTAPASTPAPAPASK